MSEAADPIDQIEKALKGKMFNKNVFVFLAGIRALSKSLKKGQKSPEIHNKLRGFIRMWSDEFCPAEEIISPLLDQLFELYGYPKERSMPK